MRPTNPSLTYSTTYFDRSFIVVVDSLLMWTLTAAVAEGPRDAESWFRAETYYIRILNVSPVFAESVWWRGAFIPSQFFLLSRFLLSQFLWLTRHVIAESVFVESAPAVLWLICCVSSFNTNDSFYSYSKAQSIQYNDSIRIYSITTQSNTSPYSKAQFNDSICVSIQYKDSIRIYTCTV